MGHTFLSPHASFGLKKGDRVAIMMRNRPEFILGFYGAVTSGMIAVPINGWLTAPEAHYCVDNADCRVLLVDQERFDRLTAGENVLASLQRKGLTVVLVPEGKPSEADRRKILQAGAVLWDDVVSGKFINGARSDLPDVQVLPEDLCVCVLEQLDRSAMSEAIEHLSCFLPLTPLTLLPLFPLPPYLQISNT